MANTNIRWKSTGSRKNRFASTFASIPATLRSPDDERRGEDTPGIPIADQTDSDWIQGTRHSHSPERSCVLALVRTLRLSQLPSAIHSQARPIDEATFVTISQECNSLC